MMKKLVVAAMLIMPGVAAASETPGSRQFCTRIETRAGSHMSYRRVCRTADQWRTALGPDWRQHLAGARALQDEYDT
jgi:hypothetical protein